MTIAQGARQAEVEEGVGRLRETRARWCVADTCPQHRLHGVRGLFASYLRILFSIFILRLSEQKLHIYIMHGSYYSIINCMGVDSRESQRSGENE